jgi:hypothetical protein
MKKAGNLKYAYERTQGEYIVIFDADFARHWFRLMSDTHARFCWTTQPCRIMLLHRGMSLSLGGDYDFDP